MINAGEIILKNKEERAIFSDTGRFCTEMCAICTNIIKQELACKSVQDSLSSHPVLVMMNSLEREKNQLEYMLGKEHQSRKDLAEWSEKTQRRIPALTEELHKKIEEIGGGSVQLQVDGLIPVRE
jgi:predicted Rossmann fold nucleotide-binding protein DprA/Smf involved in DNA uptake